MLDLVLQALQTLFAPENFMYLMLGVLLGLVIGVFPGLGGIAGVIFTIAIYLLAWMKWRH